MSSDSWVSILSSLPPKERLRWQKTITADVAAQQQASKARARQRQPPSSTLSAYVSDGKRARPSDSAFRAAVDSIDVAERWQHHNCSGDDGGEKPSQLAFLLSRMLHASFKAAGGAGFSAVSTAESASEQEAEAKLAHVISETGLDLAYGAVLAKQLGQQARTNLNFTAESTLSSSSEVASAASPSPSGGSTAEDVTRFLHIVAASKGELGERLSRALDAKAGREKPSPAPPAAAAAPTGAAPAPSAAPTSAAATTTDEEEALLAAALAAAMSDT